MTAPQLDSDPEESATPLAILRIVRGVVEARADAVATEEPLEIQLSYEKRGGLRVSKSVSVTMRTPGADAELAAGFLLTEGIVTRRDQIAEIVPAAARPGGPLHGHSVTVVLAPGVEVDLRGLERHFYTTSSCGVCGKASLEALAAIAPVPLVPGEPQIDPGLLPQLPDRLRRSQRIFEQTGGLHAAALFDETGTLLAVREDVGRHNAVDKLIGSEWLEDRLPLSRCVLLVSGRASFELMQKAIMAGIPFLAAVGAPSSLAVAVARRFNATLVGFLRDDRCNVYAGADRLRFGTGS
jgi:FdhD protein